MPARVGAIVIDSVTDTLPLVPILLIVYVALEYVSHRRGRDLVKALRLSGRHGPWAGAALGVIPQCGMSVLVTTLFLMRRVTMGALVSTYIATSDEAIPLLAAHRGRWTMILGLVGIKAVAGPAWGFATDAVMPRADRRGGAIELRAATLQTVHLGGVPWRAIVIHAVRHTLRICLLVLAVTVTFGLLLDFGNGASWLRAWSAHPYRQILPAALFGLIPNCAASVALVEAFLKHDLSAGAALAGLCTGAGLGPILLYRDADRRTTFAVLAITVGAGVVTGALVNWSLSLLNHH